MRIRAPNYHENLKTPIFDISHYINSAVDTAHKLVKPTILRVKERAVTIK
jgi:hypothetical protein